MTKLIKCWTIQDAKFLEQPGSKLSCGPEFVPNIHRIAYAWMKKAYGRVKGTTIRNYPIWLWETAAKDTEEKRYEMAASLFSEAEYSKPKIFIDLKIPSEFLLPSLYSRWNILMDYCQAFQKEPRQFTDWKGVFDLSKRKPWDQVQYAAPFIQREWIEATVKMDSGKVKGLFR